jgi:DNA adenine methylase
MAKPVLKWAGGKASILHEIEKRLAKIDTSNATLFDIFVGGASVSLKFENKFNHVVINDKNKELKCVYDVIKSDSEALIKQLKEHSNRHSHDYYYDVRRQDRLEGYKDKDEVFKAARTIYLNKTCYNGLFRVNRSGYFNVPMGRQKTLNIYDEENIRELSEIFNKFDICNSDFYLVLKLCKAGDVVYIDPPYDKINASSFVQYNAIAFDEFDQKRLVDAIDELTERGVYVIASNSYTKNTSELYKDYMNEDSIIMVKRSIASNNLSRVPVKEILVDNIDKVNKNVDKTSKK